MTHLRPIRVFTVVLLAAAAPLATADNLQEIHLAIENHRFIPVEIKVPAGKKLRLVVENRDPTPEEFESYDLNREKIVPPRGRIVLYVGPLEPGRHGFFGEFNPTTAQGALVAE